MSHNEMDLSHDDLKGTTAGDGQQNVPPTSPRVRARSNDREQTNPKRPKKARDDDDDKLADAIVTQDEVPVEADSHHSVAPAIPVGTDPSLLHLLHRPFASPPGGTHPLSSLTDLPWAGGIATVGADSPHSVAPAVPVGTDLSLLFPPPDPSPPGGTYQLDSFTELPGAGGIVTHGADR